VREFQKPEKVVIASELQTPIGLVCGEIGNAEVLEVFSVDMENSL